MKDCLQLNKSSIPIEIITWQEAVSKVFEEEAFVLANYDIEIHSPSTTMLMPSVIQLTHSNYQPKRFVKNLPFNRKNVYIRDHGHCFEENTLILMFDGNFKKIKDINIKDKVLDKNGDEQIVEYVHKEYVNDFLLEIYHRGNGTPIRLTYDHNSIVFETTKYMRQKKQFANIVDKPAKKITLNDYLGELFFNKWEMDNIVKIDILDFLPSYKYNIKLLEDDKIKYYNSSVIKRFVDITYDFGLFIGLYLAEGSIDSNRCQFAFNYNEKEYIDFVQMFVKNKFGLKSFVKYNKEKNTAVVRISSKLLRDFMLKFCYINNEKRIVNKKISNQYFNGLLAGMLYGDGHLRRDICKFVFCLKNTLLVDDIYIVSNILGIYPTLSRVRYNEKKQAREIIYQGKQFNNLLSILNNLYREKDIKKYNKDYKSDRIVDNNHIIGRVTKINKIRYSGFVYNLQVSNTRSYVANYVVTNNCMYCGKRVGLANFTFDHVLPRWKGGKTEWTNIVVSCIRCNSKKGGKLLRRTSMSLLREPYAPRLDKAAPVNLVNKIGIRIPEKSWEDYIYWNITLLP